MEGNNLNSEYESLKNSKFKQQKLPAWRPVPSIWVTIAIFLSFGVVFIIIGVLVLHFSNEIFEQTIRYDEKCSAVGEKCELDLKIDNKLDSTVMFYYQLTNFYQNHRRYVKSKSNAQLLGEYKTTDQIKSDCEPVLLNKDIKENLTNIYNDTLKDDETAWPCGLIAKSYFTDTFSIVKKNTNQKITINEKNIAWPADLELKYKMPSNDVDKRKMWMNTTDEHFVVWMRPAGLPDFRKLWGRIENGLEAGDYIIKIENNYDKKIFNGSKSVVLSTVNAFGGKNTFLGISYLVVGIICIIMAIGFFIGHKIQQKNKSN